MSGRDVPPEFIPPELRPGVSEMLEIYNECSHDRPLGFGVLGPIPRWSLNDELDRRDIFDIDQRAHIKYCIRQAEAGFLRMINKSMPRSSPPTKPNDALFEDPPLNAPALTSAIFDALFGGLNKGAKPRPPAAKRAPATRTSRGVGGKK